MPTTTSGAFADVECAICHRHISEDMTLVYNTDRGLLVVCFICEERKDEGIEDDDADD